MIGSQVQVLNVKAGATEMERGRTWMAERERLGSAANRVGLGEIVIYNWDRQAESAGLL